MEFVRKPWVQTLVLAGVVFLLWQYYKSNKASLDNTTAAE